MAGWVHVYTGPMFSGKTDELLRDIRKAHYAGKVPILFKPLLDTRSTDRVVSRAGVDHEAVLLDDCAEMYELAEGHTVVGIDEAQFFDERLPDVVNAMALDGRSIIISGLDRDFLGRGFGPMADLLLLADKVTKLQASCFVCNNPAQMTQRLINGRPAHRLDPLVVIGGMGDDVYEARCREHHELEAAVMAGGVDT